MHHDRRSTRALSARNAGGMNPENAARVQGVLCDLAAELGELGAVEKLGVDMHRGEVMVELEAEQAMKARPEEHTPHQDGRRSRRPTDSPSPPLELGAQLRGHFVLRPARLG